MTDALAFLVAPLLVSVCLVGIHTFLGLQVLARKVIFVDLALAQIAALGATTAFMLGHPPQSPATFGYSLAFTIAAAGLLASTRKWNARVPQEAWIGIVYVVSAAAAILMIDRAPQGAEHLKQVLTGNILTSGTDELAMLVPLYVGVGLVQWLLRARLNSSRSVAWDFIFYATFGVVVTSSVAIAGVLLVFSFLIIPASIGVIFADRLARQLAIGWLAGTGASAAGLGMSFVFDLPTGAAMVCTFAAVLVGAGLSYWLMKQNLQRAAGRVFNVAGWGFAVLLTISAISLVSAPRADQPLLDSLESAFPSVRSLYFTQSEQSTYSEAAVYADRYYAEAERLNRLEKQSRTASAVLDDTSVAKLSSYLKSYGEMRKGEQFVMQEVRARARERARWLIGPGMAAFALLLALVAMQTGRVTARLNAIASTTR
jgi:zinc/manganese transport system permease protein